MKHIPTCPPAKRLASEINITLESAQAMRKRIKKGYETTPGVHASHAVAAFLAEVNATLGPDAFHGVESLYPEKPSRWYLNAGDTYATTLLFNDETDTFRIGCWGDIMGG